MKKLFFSFLGFLFLVNTLIPGNIVTAQTTDMADTSAMPAQPDGTIPSLKFKEADIGIVIQAIAQKAVKNNKQVNIIVAPEVEGLVTVDLKNAYWLTALDAVLKLYDYSYEWIGEDIIMVTTLDKLAEKRQKEAAAALQEPLETVSYKLGFLDARDVEKMLKPQLTARGKITVMETEPQKGWRARGGFATGDANGSSSSTQTGDFSRAEREGSGKPRTNTLVITDTKSNVRAILDAIHVIDIMPKQVLIKTKIVEVNREKLKDIGFDYGSGATGTTTASEQSLNGSDTQKYISQLLTGSAGAYSYTNGLNFNFRKYTGNEFEVAMHALETDAKTNTLSEPNIVTLDSQEAYIMVGEKRPIIESSISANDSSIAISKKLSYYQNLGIELNVVPQICGDNFVNLIIYPSVTSADAADDVEAESVINGTSSSDYYPTIKVRETQTQVLLANKETIAIGGLLKDVKSTTVTKMPILGDIPLLGKLFQRTENTNDKIDLIIFITAEIIDPAANVKNIPAPVIIPIGQEKEEPAKDTEKTVIDASIPAPAPEEVKTTD